MTRKDITESAAFLLSVRPDKDTDRAAWQVWRGLCLREAQRHAQVIDMSAYLAACGSPD